MKNYKSVKKIISSIIAVSFLVSLMTPTGDAQVLPNLPVPGQGERRAGSFGC